MDVRTTAPEPRSNSWWVTLMLVLAGILTPIAICLSWWAFLMLDTDRFTRSVTPIIDMPEVQSAISTALLNDVDDSFDLAAQQDPAVRELLANAGVEEHVIADIAAVVPGAVASSQFRQVWEETNSVAHQGLVDLLTDELDNDLALTFADIEQWAGIDPESPTADALAAIPPELEPSIDVLHPIDVPMPQVAVDYADWSSAGAIVLVLTLFIGAMLLAGDRRQALIVAGIAALISLPCALAIRLSLHDRLANYSGAQRVLAIEYARALTSSLESTLLLVAAVGLIVTILAWVWPRLARSEPLPTHV